MKFFFKKIIARILTWEARKILRKYNPKIVAITGSVGKTSTKDAVYTVLSSSFHSRKSEKSYNSDIGIPLTILGLRNAWSNPFLWIRNIIAGFMPIIFTIKYPQWLVLEVGADSDRPTYMTELSKWLTPDITVFTSFSRVPVHVEYFGTRENLFQEKLSIVRSLKKDGILIVSHDDEEVRNIRETVTQRTLTYGFDYGASVQAKDEEIMYGTYDHTDLEFPNGMKFTLNYEGNLSPLELRGTIGRQHVYPALAGFAVGISQGMKAEHIMEALKSHKTPKGRMKLIPGLKDTLLIDDTYNSSPIAVKAALESMQKLKLLGRKIAVLGDMMELGQYSVEEHKNVGKIAPGNIDMLVAVGVRSRGTAEAALDAGMSELNVLQFDTSQEAGKYLESVIKPGDIILIKGSQSIRMERVVHEIMAKPEDARNLLVRQDKQWLAIK
jgi:UDP-N-acetylmuramyl pentapeptide synthase